MIKPVHIVIIIALIAVGAYLYLEGDLNLGNLLGGESLPEGTDSCNYNTRDIHSALCILTGKALPWEQTEAYIEALHMSMCNIDGKNYDEIGDFYENEWESDGFVNFYENTIYQSSYTAYLGGWYSGANGKAIVSGSGASITSYYGHDTVFITSHGPLVTYYSFITFVGSV